MKPLTVLLGSSALLVEALLSPLASAAACIGVAHSDRSIFVAPIGSSTKAGVVVDELAAPPAISSDGSRFIYLKSSDPNAIHVSQVSGSSSRYDIEASTDAPVGIELVAQDIVKIKRHAGKNFDEFFFYKLSENPPAAVPIAAPRLAIDCAIESTGSHYACAEAGSALSVDGVEVYRMPASEYGTRIDDFVLPVGGTGSSQKIPQVQIKYVGPSHGTAHVTIRSGEASEDTWLRSGMIVAEEVDSTVYYFSPELSADLSTVSMHVYEANQPVPDRPGRVAWSSDSRRLTLLQGSRLLTFEKSADGAWAPIARAHLSTDIGARSIRFFGPNALFVRASDGFYSIAMTDFAPAGSSVAAEKLPKTIRIPQREGHMSSVPSDDLACE